MASAFDIEVCAQMGDNDSIWVEACHLVKHDPNDNGEHVLVEIPGVRLRILKHQLIGAYFIIKQQRSSCPGGYCSDEMGYGKVWLSNPSDI